jgi:Fe-S-cluster containining protein
VSERGDNVVDASAEADESQLLRRARRQRLFDSLERIYFEFPDTVCENCARCCFESPGVFYVEYLAMLEALAEMPPPRRQEFIARAVRELFFSWVEPDRTCLFLESGRCAIYDRRPLACRLFGLVPAGDRAQAEAEARLAARQEARRLRHFGIEIPEEVVQRSLVSCDRVRDRKGGAVEVEGESLAARVARLDAALLPTEVIIEEFCFRSLPERLGASALGGETIEGLRVQLLRRAQAGESAQELVTRVVAQASLPSLLRKKPRG